jgi:cobalt-zinc-cadmium resistance protein CzcA
VLKSIITFGLTHRTVVIMALLMFLGGGFVAFTQLNIEAYPNYSLRVSSPGQPGGT